MAKKNIGKPSLKQRLIIEFNHDRKKTITLAVLGLFAVMLGGRLAFKQFGPSAARAAITSIEIASAQDGKIGAINAPNQQGKDAKPRAESVIKRDIFKFNSKMLPPAGSGGNSMRSSNNNGESAAWAGSLFLQGTMTGRSPVAIINDNVIHLGGYFGEEGDQIKVVHVTANSCIVEKNGVQVTLLVKPDDDKKGETSKSKLNQSE